MMGKRCPNKCNCHSNQNFLFEEGRLLEIEAIGACEVVEFFFFL
jgi:hypothetical protein